MASITDSMVLRMPPAYAVGMLMLPMLHAQVPGQISRGWCRIDSMSWIKGGSRSGHVGIIALSVILDLGCMRSRVSS